MKRFFLCLLLIIPVSVFVLSIASCGGKNAENVVIKVNEPGDRKFPVNDLFEVDKKVYVNAEGEYLLSDINSTHIKGDYIYTLDTNHRLSKIDLNSGEIVKQFCQVGRGPQDYLFPICITGDDELLYLIDLMGKSIHKFDYDLKHQGKINVDHLPTVSSLFKTKDGFIFYNSFENDSIGKFVITDNNGQMLKSFIKIDEKLPETDELIMRVIYTQDLFVPDSHGNLLCFNPEANEAYIFDGKDMTKLFRIEAEDTYQSESQVAVSHIGRLFRVNGNLLVDYHLKEEGYAYFDKDFNLIDYGKSDTSGLDDIFSPISQVGDKLITVITTDDTPGAVLPDRSIQAQIIIHRAK